jgi:hypothetical protein
MPDALSERYNDPLQGSYDRVHRIVLNAYFPSAIAPEALVPT